MEDYLPSMSGHGRASTIAWSRVSVHVASTETPRCVPVRRNARFQEGSTELQIPPRRQGTGRLRSEADFLISFVVRGLKAPDSICQHASPRSFDSAQINPSV